MEKLELEQERKFRSGTRVKHFGRKGTVVTKWTDAKYAVEFDDSPDDQLSLVYESELTAIPTT